MKPVPETEDHPTTLDCASGFHETLTARGPLDEGGAINIDYVCAACSLVVYTESWTREGWAVKQAKAVAREAEPRQRRTR